GLAEGDFEDVWNQVRLDPMMLAETRSCAGGVEVAEGDKFQAVNLLVPIEHLLEHELGFAVRVDGALGQILRHGEAVRRAVGGASRAEDKLLDTSGDGGVQQFEAIADIVAKVFGRVDHRFADEGIGSKMQNGLG